MATEQISDLPDYDFPGVVDITENLDRSLFSLRVSLSKCSTIDVTRTKSVSNRSDIRNTAIPQSFRFERHSTITSHRIVKCFPLGVRASVQSRLRNSHVVFANYISKR